jgi:hypothetical protein
VDSSFSEIHWVKSYDNGLKLKALDAETRVLKLPFFTLKFYSERYFEFVLE